MVGRCWSWPDATAGSRYRMSHIRQACGRIRVRLRSVACTSGGNTPCARSHRWCRSRSSPRDAAGPAPWMPDLPSREDQSRLGVSLILPFTSRVRSIRGLVLLLDRRLLGCIGGGCCRGSMVLRQGVGMPCVRACARSSMTWGQAIAVSSRSAAHTASRVGAWLVGWL